MVTAFTSGKEDRKVSNDQNLLDSFSSTLDSAAAEQGGRFTCNFSGTIDSKGRITIPVKIRDRLNLENGDTVSLSLESSKVISRKFGSEKKAWKFVSELDDVKGFSYDGETLKVILNE